MILRRHLFFLFLIGMLISSAPLTRAYDKEYIILSGGPSIDYWEKYKAVPHDRWWGNFIRAARVRIEQLRKEFGPNARITWLVYRRGYERRAQYQDHADLIGNIVSVRDKYGVNLIWFSTGADVINYLNYGLPRDQVKIANFEFYGHSNRACFMFDYSNEVDSGSKSWLHENDLKQINKGIFARPAFVKSWSCHTGESMSKKWKRATGVRMIGAIGKTDFSQGYRTGWIPILSPGGRWAH